jgi:hypothetical protein
MYISIFKLGATKTNFNTPCNTLFGKGKHSSASVRNQGGSASVSIHDMLSGDVEVDESHAFQFGSSGRTSSSSRDKAMG